MTRALQRALLSFPLPPGSLPVSAFPLPSPALAGSFVGMSAGPPRVSALLFPPRFSPVSFPLPCVRFSSTFVPRGSASGFSPSLVLPPFADAHAVWSSGTVAFSSLARCGCVFPSFPLRFLPLSFVQFSPLRFDRISPSPSARFDHPRIPCGFRFYHPEFGVRFCGPRVAPERAPHHSPRAAT
jgi:hypothetical protein